MIILFVLKRELFRSTFLDIQSMFNFNVVSSRVVGRLNFANVFQKVKKDSKQCKMNRQSAQSL